MLATPIATPAHASTYAVFPQEIQQEIASYLHSGKERHKPEEAHQALAQLLGLSTLNRQWDMALEGTVNATFVETAIYQDPSGSQLARALKRLSDVPADLQHQGWRALENRLERMGRKQVANTLSRYLTLWPAQGPSASATAAQKEEWSRLRDMQLARFAARAFEHHPELMDELLREIIQCPYPMPKLATALLRVVARHTSNVKLAMVLDERADHMPADCRPQFQAARACMRGTNMGDTTVQAMLEAVSRADPAVRCLLLPTLDGRINGLVSPAGRQQLIEAIEALPPRYRAIALERTPAVGWENRRTNLLLQCLPANPAQAATHLERYLTVFDATGQLGAAGSFQALVPVLAYAIHTLREQGVPVCLKLLALMARRIPAEDGLQHRLLAVALHKAQQMPARDRFAVSLVASALLTPHGEPRLAAFRVHLQRLRLESPVTIADVLRRLCVAEHGIPAYLFMGCLEGLNSLLHQLPPTLREPLKVQIFALMSGWPAADQAAVVRRLELPAVLNYQS